MQVMENGGILHLWACGGSQGAAVSGPHPMVPPHGVSPARVPVSQQPSVRGAWVTTAGLYIFPLGLVLPQFLVAFAQREQCIHPGDPAATRRMRALRGEGLAGGWG